MRSWRDLIGPPDVRRLRYVIVTAMILGAAIVGGRHLSWRLALATNVYGKLFLALCIVALPFSHPQWRSAEKSDARWVVADTCAAWIIGFGTVTSFLVAHSPRGLRPLDPPALILCAVFLGAISTQLADAVRAVIVDLRFTFGRAVSPPNVGGPNQVLGRSPVPCALTRDERWICVFFVLLFVAFAVREFSVRQYLSGVGMFAFGLTWALMIAPPPVRPVRRLSIYICFGIAMAPLLRFLVFS